MDRMFFKKGEGIELYHMILFAHVVTAIIGFGQTFLFPLILQLPKTGQQVLFAWELLSQFSKIAKYSDWILLGTGLTLISMSNFDFQHGWINLSILLFVFMRFSSSVISKKTVNELRVVVEGIRENEMPKEYKIKKNAFMPRLYLTQTINFLIIALMVIKPTLPFISF
jgi:uncharacterized membrane protein